MNSKHITERRKNMRYFYYVHTGHRIGLDRFHRAVAIVNELQKEIDITLLCSDFRIAGEAKEYGIKRATSVDVVRNIPQIAHHGDKIIFDSDEINPTLLEDMVQFFSTFIRISDKPDEVKHPKELLVSPYLQGEGIATGFILNERYIQKVAKNIPMALFFGDDDYEKDLETHQLMFAPYKMDLLMGFYHFLGYEKLLKESFVTLYDAEEYDQVITQTDRLISSSPMAVVQNAASGGNPIYMQRPDYVRDFIPLLQEMNIPVVEGYDAVVLEKFLNNSVPEINLKRIETTRNVIEFIRKALLL